MKNKYPDKPLRVCLIVALGSGGEIGQKNDLPWGRTLPRDLKHFRDTTKSHSLLMGRKTAESLGKPLPNRSCYVLTSKPDRLMPGFIPLQSIEEWKELTTRDGKDVAFMIGGAELIRAALDTGEIHRLYLTRVEGTFPEADCFFPEPNWAEWRNILSTSFSSDENNQYGMTFETWERIDCLRK